MSTQVSSVKVEAGLYVLHYVRSSVASPTPTVSVQVSPESVGIIEVITPPRVRPGTIDAPGGCLVIRSERAGQLQVSIESARGVDSDEAELRLDLLSSGGTEGALAPVADAQATSTSGVELVGHVSRRGDVRVLDGSWVAGPDAPAPIEGISARILATSGSAVQVEYQVLVGGQGGTWTNWMSAGQYAGTRGQFRSLLGVRLRMSGEGRAAAELHVEALFLGSAVQSSRGQLVELISGSGVDPLVGLKIALNVGRSKVEQTSAAPKSPIIQPVAKREGRVRVFRASGLR